MLCIAKEATSFFECMLFSHRAVLMPSSFAACFFVAVLFCSVLFCPVLFWCRAVWRRDVLMPCCFGHAILSRVVFTLCGVMMSCTDCGMHKYYLPRIAYSRTGITCVPVASCTLSVRLCGHSIFVVLRSTATGRFIPAKFWACRSPPFRPPSRSPYRPRRRS